MGTNNEKQDNQHRKYYKYLLSTIPIVTLEQAIQPLIPILPKIQTYVRIVKDKCNYPADGLTSDQSASIMIYSMGWQPLDECLYVVLNRTLRTINRENLQPWFLYLKLLFSAILHLPSIYLNVYRNCQFNLKEQYKKNEIFHWWDLSLCTILQLDKNNSQKILFQIECHTIKDIHNHTYFSSDNSVLILLPGTKFRVIQCINQEIILKEIQSSFLLENV